MQVSKFSLKRLTAKRVSALRLTTASACAIAALILIGCSANSLLSNLQQSGGGTTQTPPAVPAPTFSPSAGTYFTAQTVTLSDTDSSAKIYYTTDGTTPSTSSTLFGSSSISIAVNSTPITIKAIAVDPTKGSSVVSNGTFSALQLAQWAITNQASSTIDNTQFATGAVDSSGDIYAVGSYGINSVNTSSISFVSNTGSTGGATSYSGTSPSGGAMLVKFNSSSTPQCDSPAVSNGGGASRFLSVALDSSQDAYAVGDISGTGTESFGGTSGSVTGANTSSNAVVVKYSSSCQAQWAVTTLGATTNNLASGPSDFYGVSVNSSTGYIYATGDLEGSTVFYGNGISASQAKSGTFAGVVVAYNASGTAQWASAPVSATAYSGFYASAEDSNGNVYVGAALGTGTFNFGNGVTVTSTGNPSGALIKYNSSGTALWADVFANAGSMEALAIDSAGDVYVPSQGVIIKVSPNGTVLSNPSPLSGVTFVGISLDSSGNVYATGTMNGTATENFGNGVSATGVYSSGNDVVVKYSSSGVAQWAQTLKQGSNSNYFGSIGVDSSGNSYAVGSIYGGSLFDFGNGQTATGPSSAGLWSVVVVKYGP